MHNPLPLSGSWKSSADIFKMCRHAIEVSVSKVFLARDHKRCRIATQVEAAAKWGAEERHIWKLGTKKKEYSWQHVLDPEELIIRAGDTVGAYFLWLIPLTGKHTRIKPSVQLREIVDTLFKANVEFEELATGRTFATPESAVQIYDDAIKQLARRSGSEAGPGRPKKHIYSDDDWAVIEGIWRRPEHRNNADRVAAVRERFSAFTQAAWYEKHGKKDN